MIVHAGCTVIVNVHVPVFAAASVAVHVTVVVPTANDEPEAGTHTTVAPGQLSDGVGTVYVTVAEPDDGGDSTTVMFEGQVTVGACVSWIVTVKKHDPSGLFGEVSLAVHATVVTPTGKFDPLAGRQLTVAPGQLSVADDANVTTAEHWPAAFGTVTGAGQFATGACVSLTVTVNEHVGPLVVVQLTVVVPTAKNDPEDGVQVTVPHTPVVVGAG